MSENQVPVWETEPNQKFFKHGNVKCAILRTRFGNLCGYVQLPLGPLRSAVIARSKRFSPRLKSIPGMTFKSSIFSKVRRQRGYDLPALQDVEVHGGLTYCSTRGRGNYLMRRGVWVGFDCAHCDDLIPGMAALIPENPFWVTYRDMAYVEDQVRSMADQIWLLHGIFLFKKV